MNYFYRSFIRPFFFLFNPELVHDMMMVLLKVPLISGFIGFLYRFDKRGLSRNVCGLNFPNPVGLAAGFDKDAECIDAWQKLGFGFVEIGTVTPLPQPGNSKPRLFRLIPDEAVINRMGFNNSGVDQIRRRLSKPHANIIVGGNIGKNKLTPNKQAVSDYKACFESLFDVVDYFVVNVSSPNTPHLRELQEKEPLSKLLSQLVTLNRSHQSPKPIFLKIAPDLSTGQIDDIIDIVKMTGIDGIIATNTTITRHGLRSTDEKVAEIGDGGLSGKPLRERATEIIRYIHQKSAGSIPIIGVGGIHSPQDALEKLEAGASLVQIYTGFIYEGPGLIKDINREIRKLHHGTNQT